MFGSVDSLKNIVKIVVVAAAVAVWELARRIIFIWFSVVGQLCAARNEKFCSTTDPSSSAQSMVSSPAEEALSRITCHSRNRRRCSLLEHQSSNSAGLSSCFSRSRRQRRMYSARLWRWMTSFSVSPGAGERTGGRPTNPNEDAAGLLVCCWV